MIRKVLPLAAALALTLSAANAQDSLPQTPFQKQLSRIDLSIQGIGMFQKNTSGKIIPAVAPNAGATVGNQPSNTLGALVTVRYIAKPLVGLEFNYGYARYTENFSGVSGSQPNIGVQSQVNEYTIGYVITPAHELFGFQPYVSAGAGSTGFKPTPGGGLGLKTQARATYYYSAGLQQEFFNAHFGLRAGFRQVFFLAPDYGQNYLTILQHTTTYEPSAGFYLKF